MVKDKRKVQAGIPARMWIEEAVKFIAIMVALAAVGVLVWGFR